jgi:Transcriptional regulator, AbiEi antitoxin/Protein of unknown function (DUF559)
VGIGHAAGRPESGRKGAGRAPIGVMRLVDAQVRSVADLAARQHGVISRSQLTATGLSRTQITWLISRGHLHRIHRGVYAVGHERLTQQGIWLAAVLACGPGSFLSHGPAGQLQGLIPRRERLALHVSLTADRSPAGIVTHRPRSLPPGDTRRRLGIPVTTGTRTVWDLAAILTPLRTRRAFEQAEKLRLLDRDRMASLLAGHPSHRGAGTIRELLSERMLPLGETRSWLEELAMTTCRDHSLPLPAVNVPVLGWEVDLLWESARFIVEADGADHLSPRQRDSDNDRDAALGRAGYLVRRYSSAAMSRSAAVAAEIAAILRDRP